MKGQKKPVFGGKILLGRLSCTGLEKISIFVFAFFQIYSIVYIFR
jgi:hypothetical protein